MEILNQSFQVFTQDWPVILGLLGFYLLGSATLWLWLKNGFGAQLTVGEGLAVSLGGGFVPLLIGILAVMALRLGLGIKLSFASAWLGIFGLSGLLAYRFRPHPLPETATLQPRTWLPALFLLLLFSGSLYLRLAFLDGLTVPLYYDSVMHYGIIADLSAKFNQASLPDFSTFASGYYHLGYHLLASAFSLTLKAEIAKIMLVWGPILLVLLPLPVFFLVRQETGSDAAALWACLLAGWGWAMPAHAINWGKFPALTSLLAFEWTLCSVYLLWRAPQKQRLWFGGLSVLGFLFSTLLHTRSLVILGLALGSAGLAWGWSKLPRLARWISFGGLCAGLAALLLVINSKPALQMLYEPYQETTPWLAVSLLLLLPVALKAFPRATLASLLFIAFSLASLLFSVSQWLTSYVAQTLLDRPIVEMYLSIPFAFLGGLGLAGLLQTLQKIPFLQTAPRLKTAQALATLLLFGAAGNALTQAPLLPAECCDYFNPDDLAAFDWMEDNLPAEARILVPATSGTVFENGPTGTYAGSDAGLWVTILLKRSSVVLSTRVNFSSVAVHDQLCQYDITQIYVGSRGAESFDPENLRQTPEWYQAQFELPTAQVFRLTGCP